LAKFGWPAQDKMINQFTHFRVDLDGFSDRPTNLVALTAAKSILNWNLTETSLLRLED
jgi:hypothetical protein